MSPAKPAIDHEQLVGAIKRICPKVLSIYLFGSSVDGTIRNESDLDVALLIDSALTPEVALAIKSFVSSTFRRDTDVVDLRRADSVTAVQIIIYGEVIFCGDSHLQASFETYAMSRYALLNEERSGILEDIERTGTIYGR